MAVKHQVYEAMREILPNYPLGIRASELERMISDRLPDALPKSIGAVFAKLTREYPKEFSSQRLEGKGTFYFSVKNDATDDEGDNTVSQTLRRSGMAAKGSLADKVYKEMKDILPKYIDGLRASELKRIISERLPNDKTNSIGARTSLVTEKYPKEFDKVKVKGGGTIYFYVPNSVIGKKDDNIATQTAQYKEEDFYASFASYLQYGDSDDENDHLDECTKAIPLGGGSALQGKWATPDVIGVLRPYDNDDVAFPDEIVSAEIKSEKSNSSIIIAFGQACAYRLFSHKVYLVIPKPTDNNRIEKLCQIFGIGLVYFDPDQEPDISIYKLKLPAQKHSPDMFYVNEIVGGNIADELYDRKIRRHRTRKRK